jgi:TolB-like protein
MRKNQVVFALAFFGMPILAGLAIGDHPTALGKENVAGTVKSVSADGKEITLSIGSGASAKEERVRLTAGTKITVDNKAGKSADIAAGMRVTISYDKKSKEAVAIEATTGTTDSGNLVLKCQELCEEITKGYKGKDSGSKPTIAVVEFSDLSGGVTDFGRLLSEELITKLFATGNYKVVERLHLNKAMAEHKLQFQGFVDPKSAKELGKILGLDAIVSGTVADLGSSFRVNARVFSTQTGEVLATAAATFGKDEQIRHLLSEVLAQPGGGTNSGFRNKTQPVKLPFHEDFSTYQQDDVTSWGKKAKVRKLADQRNWLVATSGVCVIGMDVELPASSYIEFEYLMETNFREQYAGQQVTLVRTGISLIDEAGKKFRMDWVFDSSWGGPRKTMALPGGVKWQSGLTDSKPGGTILVTLKGDTVQFFSGDDTTRPRLTGNVSDFKKFTRFEIDLYKGSTSMFSVTNIKVGSR